MKQEFNFVPLFFQPQIHYLFFFISLVRRINFRSTLLFYSIKILTFCELLRYLKIKDLLLHPFIQSTWVIECDFTFRFYSLHHQWNLHPPFVRDFCWFCLFFTRQFVLCRFLFWFYHFWVLFFIMFGQFIFKYVPVTKKKNNTRNIENNKL